MKSRHSSINLDFICLSVCGWGCRWYNVQTTLCRRWQDLCDDNFKCDVDLRNFSFVLQPTVNDFLIISRFIDFFYLESISMDLRSLLHVWHWKPQKQKPQIFFLILLRRSRGHIIRIYTRFEHISRRHSSPLKGINYLN